MTPRNDQSFSERATLYQRILVPVDGSHTSTLGLQEAIRIAIDQRARRKK